VKRRRFVLILDFGSQYTQLIARRVREAGVYCEVRPYDLPRRELGRLQPAAVILSGSPQSATAADAYDTAFLFLRRIKSKVKPGQKTTPCLQPLPISRNSIAEIFPLGVCAVDAAPCFALPCHSPVPGTLAKAGT
jgi:hypothetical protein